MRPERLTIENFGPFHGEKVVVDFTALDRLFLVTGDTGAGKTTIFDAMCFALYGKPLGTRDGTSLRSQRAKEDEPTSVELVFRLRDKRYKVARSPEFLRRKKRGEGTTKADQAVAFFREEAGVFVADTGKTTDVNRKIVEEIGLSYENFSQILVLPQGQFQQFLELSTDKRSELLERLFPVTMHRSLIALAKEDAKRREDELARRATLLAALVEGGLDPSRIDELRAAHVASAEAARAASAGADEAWSVATSARTSAGEVLRRFAEYDAANESLTRAASRADEVEAKRLAIASSRRARRISASIARERTSVRSLEEAHEEARALVAELAEHRSEAARLEVDAQNARPLREELASLEREEPTRARRIADLSDVVAIDEALARLDRESTKAEADLATLRAEVASDEAFVRVLAEKRASLVELGASRDAVADALRSLEGVASAANFLESAERIRGELHTSREEERRARTVAEGSVAGAERAVAAAEAALTHDQAAVIATTLADGAPCPVCGSADHPAPATRAAEVAELERTKQIALDRLEECRTHLERTVRAIGIGDERIRAHEERTESERAHLGRAGFATTALWTAAVGAERERSKSLASQLEGLRAEVVAGAPREKALEKKRETQRAQEARSVERSTARAGLVGRREAHRVAFAGDAVTDASGALADEREQARLATARRTELTAFFGRTDAALAALATTRTRLETARAASDERVAQREATRARDAEALAIALSDEGFTDEAAALVCLRDAEVDASDEQFVDRHDREVQRARDAIERLAPLLAGVDRPDADALEANERACREARDATAELRRVALSKLEAFEERAAAYSKGRAEQEAFESESKAIFALRRTLGGDNAANVDFATFALERFLEAVLAQGSLRFLRLTSGRYEFVLDVTVDDRRSGAGLDIDVFDSHTGSRRDVKTLSGGEKFMASLSLALGLSDVIEARAGGIALDALFIDEGFGSLDGEALDRALSVLDEVGASRMVGVISHVDTMRSAIPSQLRVERGALGSKVTLV